MASTMFFQKPSSGKAVGVLIDVDDVTEEHIKARLTDPPEHLLDPKTRHRDNLYRDAVIEHERKLEESKKT